MICSFFFFNDTATTEIYTLSLHDALPILALLVASLGVEHVPPEEGAPGVPVGGPVDAEAADDLVHVQRLHVVPEDAGLASAGQDAPEHVQGAGVEVGQPLRAGDVLGAVDVLEIGRA